MFNFNELAIVQPNEPNCYRGSFVGIRKDKYLGKMAFTLPKGFENFKVNYDNVKNLFFAMYRTFEKFRQNKERYLDKDEQNKDNAQIENNNGAYIFTDEDNNETVLYSKIDLIDKIFQTYQELEIESLIQELGLIEEVDYSKIENYLDKGIFLSNHAIFIENMVGYRNIVRGVPSELIELFCYIYKELASELEKELSEQIKEISFNFSYKYLSPEQSLFSQHSFESTISILKDCLDNIHKTTAYKNYQYWDIYEAVEHFLYGSLEFDGDSNQGFWGINNFSYIWEDMCNYAFLKNQQYKIIYCDSNTLQMNEYQPKLSKDKNNNVWIDTTEIQNIFHFELNEFPRYIRPDIILKSLQDINLLDEFKKNKSLVFDKKYQGITNVLDVKISINDNLSNDIHKIMLSQTFEMLKKEFNNLSLSMVKNTRFGKMIFLQNDENLVIKQVNNIEFTETPTFIQIKNISKDIYNEIYNKIHKEIGEISKNSFNIPVFIIIDWKYRPYQIFLSNNTSYIKKDIIKSLAYEFCLSQITDKDIINAFGVPYYNLGNDGIVSRELLNHGIKLFKINFIKVQEIYLND